MSVTRKEVGGAGEGSAENRTGCLPVNLVSLCHLPPPQDGIGSQQVAPDPSSMITSCLFRMFLSVSIFSPWFVLLALLLRGIVFIQETKDLLRNCIVPVHFTHHTFCICM